MCIKFFIRDLTAFSVLFCMILAPLNVHAGTEYVIGLTTHGIRNASIEEIETGLNYQLANFTKAKDYTIKIKVYPNANQLSDAIEISPEYITNLMAVIHDVEGPMTKEDFKDSVKSLGGAIKSKKLLESYNYSALRKIELQDLNRVSDLISSLGKDKGYLNG